MVALQASQVQAVQAQVPTTFGAPVANAVRQGPAVQGGNAGRSSRPTRQHAANATTGHPTTLAQLPTMNAGANATGANVAQPASISTWAANVNNAQGGRPLPASTPQNTMMPPAAKGPCTSALRSLAGNPTNTLQTRPRRIRCKCPTGTAKFHVRHLNSIWQKVVLIVLQTRPLLLQFSLRRPRVHLPLRRQLVCRPRSRRS